MKYTGESSIISMTTGGPLNTGKVGPLEKC